MAKHVIISTIKGLQYIRVCESYRNSEGKPRSRAVESHGRLDVALEKDPAYLDNLRARIAKENELEREARTLGLEVSAAKRIERIEKAVKGYEPDYSCIQKLSLGSALIRAVWKQLKMPQLFRYLQGRTAIEYPYEKVAFLLTAERLLAPGSKLKAFERKEQHIVDFAAVDQLNDVYRVLDRLNQDKKNIVRHLNRELDKRLERRVTAAFYDVTTFAFESRMDGELRNFGMSKDHKINEVQVVLGLVMDENGIPLDYELFPGNTSEFGTMIPIIQRLKKSYHLETLVVVADRGLNSNENLRELKNIGCDFVLAQKVKNCSADQKQTILSDSNWEELLANSDGEVVCKYKKMNITKELFETKVAPSGRKYQTKNVLDTIDVNWIVSYSQKRADKDLHELNRAVEKAEVALKTPGKLTQGKGFKSYISFPKTNNPTLNKSKIDEARKWAGYYAVCTNLVAKSSDEIMKIYRQLWKIEDCFRISKSTLETRPCFVWKDERIHGHFVSCYISLVFEKYMEYVVKKALSTDSEPVTAPLMIAAMREAEVGYDNANSMGPVFYRLYPEGLFDRMLELFELEPPCRQETHRTLAKKLKMRDLRVSCSTTK